MKANNSAVLSNDDLVVYTSLERLLSSTHAENLTRLYSSINDSLKNGIYPTSYLLRVRDFMNNKISYVSEHIKELHEKLLSLTNVNKQLSSIVKAHKKNNTIYLFDCINGAIKSKRKEDIVDEKILIEYDMRDGSTYNSIVETDKNNIINNIKKAFEIGEEVFDVDSAIKKFAKKVYKEKDMFFLGRGIDQATAMEGSLKLKEISYIHSEAYAAGELKHGPIALIEKDVTVIAIMTDPSLTPKTISNLQEVITRGAKTMVITNQDLGDKVFENTIRIPKTSPFISPVLSIIPLQLFAYFISKEKGLDVDKPRNLAKSVTVE